MKLNFILYFLLFTCFFSCSNSDELIERLDGRWELQRTEGKYGDFSTTSPWEIISIKNWEFQLIQKDKNDEITVAKGVFQLCDNSILKDCYQLIVESKTIESSLPIEESPSKVMRYIDGKLVFHGICCEESTYFF